MEVVYLGSFTVPGTISIYELINANGPATIYFALTDANDTLPATPLCKIQQLSNAQFAANLPAPAQQFYANCTLKKYRMYLVDVESDGIIYAHYGQLRSGGLSFTSADILASDKDEYVGYVDFYSIDMQSLYQGEGNLSSKYPLVQQESFDIARYEDGKRADMNTLQSDSAYPKLLTTMQLSGNDLLLTCKDTSGADASTYLARMLGIAETAMNVYCKVTVVGMDAADNIDMLFEQIIANADRGDGPMHIILPKIANDIVAVRIYTEYTIEIQTIGETLIVNNELVLTDEQIALLRPITVNSLSSQATVVIRIVDAGAPVPNQSIAIAGLSLTTNYAGVVTTKLYPGDYAYYFVQNNKSYAGMLQVADSQTFTIEL